MDVYAGLMVTTRLPVRLAALRQAASSRCQPLSRIARFKPDFCLTRLPGWSGVPAAEAVMFLMRKASKTTRLLPRAMVRPTFVVKS